MKDFIYECIRQIKEDTIFSSNPNEILEHKKFKEILGIGKVVIKYLLENIEEAPLICMGALSILSGEDPVVEKERGMVNKMIVAWKDWEKRSRKNGIHKPRW